MIAPQLEFRPLREDDIPLLWDWLNRPHVALWWRGEQSMEEVREKYLPRIAGNDLARPFVALEDGVPVGYIQYYVVADGDPDWWPDAPGPGVLGVDLFIGESDRLGCGLGTAMVRHFVAHLMRDTSIREVRIDPHPDNVRAIRCYEKAGFRRVRPITTPDGPALWMVYERPATKETGTVMTIEPILQAEYPRVVDVWEASVRATHDFLVEDDIALFRTLVPEFLGKVTLVGIRGADGEIVAFLGVADKNIEMLFIHPDARGTGMGRALTEYALGELGADTVDVNEQNGQAVGFYLHMGFGITGRSEVDEMGKPYPLLHMRIGA